MDIYNRIVKFLSSFVDVFEDLSVYDVPPMPKDGRIAKADEPVTDNGNIMTDKFGRWKVNETVERQNIRFKGLGYFISIAGV